MEPQNTPQQPTYHPSFSQATPEPINQPQSPMMPPPHQSPPLHHTNIGDKIEQIVMLSYLFVAALLLFRFTLGIFGARRSPFVDFVYDISTPFMIPFSGMFGAIPRAGVYSIEFEALVALIVYALLFFGLARLIKILFK